MSGAEDKTSLYVCILFSSVHFLHKVNRETLGIVRMYLLVQCPSYGFLVLQKGVLFGLVKGEESR